MSRGCAVPAGPAHGGGGYERRGSGAGGSYGPPGSAAEYGAAGYPPQGAPGPRTSAGPAYDAPPASGAYQAGYGGGGGAYHPGRSGGGGYDSSAAPYGVYQPPVRFRFRHVHIGSFSPRYPHHRVEDPPRAHHCVTIGLVSHCPHQHGVCSMPTPAIDVISCRDTWYQQLIGPWSTCCAIRRMPVSAVMSSIC